MTDAGPDLSAGDAERIMLAAVGHAVFDGWTPSILALGAADAGCDAGAAERAFPNGVPDLIAAFSDWADRAMLAGLAEYDPGTLKGRKRIACAIRLRLECLAPYREAVRRLSAYFALPGHAALGARLIAATVNRIWYESGDRATDFNYYTKRGLLISVYGATVLYWLADESDGFSGTWDFLDRRLDDVLKIPHIRARALDALGRIPNPVKFWRLLNDRPI